MEKESNRNYSIYFTEEFNRCLDHIQAFFAEQGEDVLEWFRVFLSFDFVDRHTIYLSSEPVTL